MISAVIETHERSFPAGRKQPSISARTRFKTDLLHEISHVPSILKRIFQKLTQKNLLQRNAKSIILEIPHSLSKNKPNQPTNQNPKQTKKREGKKRDKGIYSSGSSFFLLDFTFFTHTENFLQFFSKIFWKFCFNCSQRCVCCNSEVTSGRTSWAWICLSETSPEGTKRNKTPYTCPER